VYAHEDIGNYVSPDDLDEMHHNQLSIGMHGRSIRHADSEDPKIVHIKQTK
jgi:hypothetical protein